VKVDVTYVDNAAEAHVLALDRLAPGSAIAGKTYFISNGEPIDLYDFVNRILATAGLQPVTKTVAVWQAKLAGRVLERVYALFRLTGEPAMTRFLAGQLSTSHWYDISAAKRELGYEPKVSIAEGLTRLGAIT
jgi:nucleoside-diphosphate-sugar epimerase